MSHRCPAGLIQLAVVIWSLTSTAVNRGGRADGCFCRSAWSCANVCRAFRAAPVNFTSICPVKVGFTSRYAPPAYVRTALWNLQRSQFRPSSAWPTPVKELSAIILLVGRGGTTGSTPAMSIPTWAQEADGCSRVGVWFPEDTKSNVLAMPNTNDPNASLTVRITPPPSFSGLDNPEPCSMRYYHYKDPP